MTLPPPAPIRSAWLALLLCAAFVVASSAPAAAEPTRPGDIDCDGDVDSADVDLLLEDRDQPVEASRCGTACDLDGDGRITILDARRLVLLCTRSTCATEIPSAGVLQEAYQQSGGLVIIALTGHDVRAAEALRSLAEVRRAQGRIEEAAELYRRALAASEGVSADGWAAELRELGLLHQQLGQADDAEALFEQALFIHRRVHHPQHPQVASSLRALAELYRERGDLARAEQLSAEALQIEMRLSVHPRAAQATWQLARLHELQGRLEQAVALYQRALAIARDSLGDEDELTSVIRSDYARLVRRIRSEELPIPLPSAAPTPLPSTTPSTAPTPRPAKKKTKSPSKKKIRTGR